MSQSQTPVQREVQEAKRGGRRVELQRSRSYVVVPTSEFSRSVLVEPWPAAGIAVALEAEPAECAALAERFDLLELRALKATGRLDRVGGELVLRARLEAWPVQACVVTLEPVATTLAVDLERRWRPSAAPMAPAEDLLDPDAVEVEPLEGRTLDLGAVLAEELGSALDPYPRAPAAAGPVPDLGPAVTFDQPDADAQPFAVLAALTTGAER